MFARKYSLMKKIGLVILILVALSLSIVAGVIFFRPNLIVTKEQAKQDLMQSSSHFVSWRGAEIHYTEEGSGFPVLLIHGFGGSFRNFQKLNDSLKNEYRVIRVDLPGFGLSDQTTVDSKTNFVELYHDFMTFFVDTLHLDSMYVVGNSMGGMMAWNMAAYDTARVKKLVLLNAAGYELDKISKKAAGAMKKGGLEFLFERGMPLAMSESGAEKCYADHSKIDYEEVKVNNEMWNRAGNIKAAFAMASSGQFPDSTLISKVVCPTLIVWGREDEVIPSEHTSKFKRDIRNSRAIVYNNCGHVPMIETPERLVPDVRKFFSE